MSKKDEALKLALEAFETLTQYNMVRANIFRRFEPTCTGDYVDLKEFREKAEPAITALREALADQPAPVQQCMEHGECFGGECIYPATQPAQPLQMQSDPSATLHPELYCQTWNAMHPDMAVAEQPAQATELREQEPVAWMYPDDYERMTTSETFCTVYSVEVGSATRGESTVALYTSPPAQEFVCSTGLCHYKSQQQEPVAWKWENKETGKSGVYLENPEKFFDLSVASIYDWTPLYTSPPAQRTWVGLTDDERLEVAEIDGADEWFWKVCKAIEAKLKEKNA